MIKIDIKNILWILILTVSLSPSQVGHATEQPQSTPKASIMQHTAQSFVMIQYHVKRSGRLRGKTGGSEYEKSMVLPRLIHNNTLDVFGVLISERGEIFTDEKDPLDWDNVERITVTGPDGVVMGAQPDRLLIGAPGQILRVTGKLPETWRVLDFAELGTLTAQTKLHAVTVSPDEEGHFSIGPCEYRQRWSQAPEHADCLRLPAVINVAVICNEQGRALGVTSIGKIDLGSTGPIWRGADILNDPGVTGQQRAVLEQRLTRNFTQNIYDITLTFRPPPQEEEAFDFGGLPHGYGGSAMGGEQLKHGLGFSKNQLLIPGALPREMVAGIDTVSVLVEGKRTPARFVGILRECHATVIELLEGSLPHTVTLASDSDLPRTEPFWTVQVRELAGRDIRIRQSRWLYRNQGYADQWHPIPTRGLLPGSWLLNPQGQWIGLYIRPRYDHDRLIPYLLNERPRNRLPNDEISRSALGYRLFTGQELGPLLSNVSAHLNPFVRHLSKEQQKRRPWLGVEYTRLNRDMAKQMNLRKQTEDGAIGLMINRIYPGSPAARLGLIEGDILLTIELARAPWPLDRAPDEREDDGMPDFDMMDAPPEFERMGYRMPRTRPWPSRSNYLTRLLAEIGIGTSTTLSCLHHGQVLEKEFTIEQAPPDTLSADRYKNGSLGLTVKDLTYEVHAALVLPPSTRAVIVAQVEQGKAAALARINRYDVIKAVDSQTVSSVDMFERLVAEAQQNGKSSVRLTVEWMGETRLADLKFNATNGAGTPDTLRRR